MDKIHISKTRNYIAVSNRGDAAKYWPSQYLGVGGVNTKNLGHKNMHKLESIQLKDSCTGD